MEPNWLSVGWKVLLLRGVLGILLGIIAIAAPIVTAVAFALLWGLWALVDGFGLLAQAFHPDSPRTGRLLLVLLAVIALVAGVIAVTRPGMTAVALTWVLGLWLVVRGLFEVAGALAATASTPRALLVASGLVDLLLGGLFVLNPGRGVVGIALLLGIIAIVWGVVFVAMAFVVRRVAGELSKTQPVVAGVEAAPRCDM